MQLQLQTVVLAALALEGAMAQPAHRHGHQHHHKRTLREVLSKRWGTPPGGWDNPALYQGVDWAAAYAAGQNGGSGSGSSGATGAAAAKAKDAVSPSSSDASSPSGSGSSGATNNPGTGSCANIASAKVKRATSEEINYIGNTGGASYGSNLIPQATCGNAGTYSITFNNNMGSEQTIWLWNKGGAGGTINGMMTTPAVQFKLNNGQSGTVEVQSNSQVGFSIDCGRAASNGNVPNCNIGEANFNDQNTHGGSFYDVSMVTYNDIKNQGGNPQLVPTTISAPGYSDSTDTNCVYTEGSQDVPVNPGADGKCAMGPSDSSPFHISVTYG